MTLAGAVLLATAVACAHREQPAPAVERPFAATLTATVPDSGENELDQKWRLFCDLLGGLDGGVFVGDWGGTVACQNHMATLAPGDGGVPPPGGSSR